MTAPTMRGAMIGEFIGTFLLVLFGCGSVAAAVLTEAQVGIFQVAIIWGLGVAIAIFLTAGLSGAHLNPAVTCALAVCSGFPPRRVGPYLLAQLAGAFSAAAMLHAIFLGPLTAFEAKHGIVRNAVGSEASAMIFGEYFPNPGGQPLSPLARTVVTSSGAFLVEAVGTAILVLVILGVTDPRNAARPRGYAPLIVGFTLTVLISLFAPLTQAGFNPARDLGPRIWSALAGWGRVPFAANGWGWLTVYILAPLVGGVTGAAFYRAFLNPYYPADAK
jgi:glycerol uptake facilitator protein